MVRLLGTYGLFLHFWANSGYLLLLLRMITNHRRLFYYLFSMAVTAARRLSTKPNTPVFKKQNNNIATRNHHPNSAAVCKYWLQGRCTRNPCRFSHPNQHDYVWKNPNSSPPKRKFINNKENCDFNRTAPKTEQKAIGSKNVNHKENCDYNRTAPKTDASKNDTTEENGVEGESVNCHNLHSWFGDKGLSVLARLEGHSKDVTGIVFPSGSSNLYCGSKDKSLRVWDCNSGQCVDVINFDEECGTLVEEGPWIFAGLRDMIKAWNRETQNAVVIRASGGMVNAITMFEDVLFAGTEDGTVLSWKSTSKSSFSDESTSLKGHTGSVLSLIIGAKKLFSGSADCTIRVWDVESLECKHVLNGHSGDVTSVICWDQYLFSGSLDKTIKVWGATASGNIEEVYRHDADDGVLAFCGMHDSEEKPILLCSCKDNGVCIYDLPSFGLRGRIYSRHDVKAIQVGSEGLLFTGDAAGLVSVWKPNGESVSKSQ
ncbi:putative transcription factor C3H family [Helianthus annuus]|nr:putative transcription factor C3H family [Helianthus annuus]